MRDGKARHIDARHLATALALGVFFALTAITASFATPGPSVYGAMTPPDPAIGHCLAHYAGQCPLSYPCYHYRLSGWRYGDQRDFECFILNRN